MIHTIKKEISMNKELRSKIELACRFSNNTPKIKERKFENCWKNKFSLCRAS
mgnify:FL=1